MPTNGTAATVVVCIVVTIAVATFTLLWALWSLLGRKR